MVDACCSNRSKNFSSRGINLNATTRSSSWSRGRRLPLLPTRLDDLGDDGEHREHDDDGDDHVDVLRDVGDRPAEQVAGPREAGDPPDPPEDVEEEETAVGHLADP